MRDIKFRAYAQNSEVMVYQKDFNKWIDGFIMHVDFKPWDDCETELMAEYIWIENEGETHNPDNPPVHSSDDMVKLMQYTGLTDKNGTEIYEGDIGWDEHRECYGIVMFDEGKFVYVWENICEDLFETNIEVIGNVYEDSHLLED